MDAQTVVAMQDALRTAFKIGHRLGYRFVVVADKFDREKYQEPVLSERVVITNMDVPPPPGTADQPESLRNEIAQAVRHAEWCVEVKGH